MKNTYTIQTQLILFLLPAVFVLSIVFPLVFFEVIGSELQRSTEQEEINNLRAGVSRIERTMDGNTEMIIALEKTPPFQGIIRATETGYDQTDTSTLTQWKDRLSVIFRSHIEANSTIQQLRYLNEKGDELVRVHQSGGLVIRAPEASLQNKSFRPYFIETMKLGRNEVYVSKAELNQEYGVIEKPYKLVVRIAVPVFSPSGERKGILVGNFRVNTLFSDFDLLESHNAIIIDQDGYYIHGDSPEKLYGFDLGKPQETFYHDEPAVADTIVDLENGSLFEPGDQTDYIWNRIHYNSVNPKDYWTLIARVDHAELLAPIKNFRSIIVSVSLILSFVLTALILYVSQRIAHPISTITKSAIAISTGNIHVHIPEIGTHKEVFALSQSLRTMQFKLEKSHKELEEKVEERTKKLEQALTHQKESNEAMLNVMEDLEFAKQRIEEEVSNTKKFQLAVDNSTDAVVITDTQHAIIYANPAWSKETGYSIEEARGQNARILTSNQTPKAALAAIKMALENGDAFNSDEFINKRKDGSLYNTELTVYPAKHADAIVYWIGIHKNITSRKREDAAKSEFISLASHQLRTPLTTIKWIFEMFTKGKAGTLDKFQSELMGDAHSCAQRMSESIGTMLTLSRIEAGKLHIAHSETDICSILQTVIDGQQLVIEKKKQQLNYSCPEGINLQTDTGLLTEIINNLLSNAIKYTPNAGTIGIQASKEGEMIRIDIADTGMGIPANEQEKVFSKFFRAENAISEVNEGTGLGLYLVKTTVEMLGGKITFTSEVNKGTTFTILLPHTPPNDGTRSK